MTSSLHVFTQEINDRMAYLIEKIVRQIREHAESLHQEVDMITQVTAPLLWIPGPRLQLRQGIVGLL